MEAARNSLMMINGRIGGEVFASELLSTHPDWKRIRKEDEDANLRAALIEQKQERAAERTRIKRLQPRNKLTVEKEGKNCSQPLILSDSKRSLTIIINIRRAFVILFL